MALFQKYFLNLQRSSNPLGVSRPSATSFTGSNGSNSTSRWRLRRGFSADTALSAVAEAESRAGVVANGSGGSSSAVSSSSSFNQHYRRRRQRLCRQDTDYISEEDEAEYEPEEDDEEEEDEGEQPLKKEPNGKLVRFS